MDSRDVTSHSQQLALNVVCVYAEQKDEEWYKDLKVHLVQWERAGKITWLEKQAGDHTARTMEQHLKQADLILLLLSPDFFKDDPCYSAMHSALKEKERRSVLVVPIIARACDWEESACGPLNVLPDNELPIAEWTHHERAYKQISVGLARSFPGLSPKIDAQAKLPQPFQAPDLLGNYVARSGTFNAIKHRLLDRQGGQTMAITLALRGAGGIGKTTLAVALCHNQEIKAAFPGGILWVVLGEQPSKPLDQLNGLLASLDPSASRAVTLEEAQYRWRTALKDRTCLLVIDDVWDASALGPLLEGGPHCIRLITTRNEPVLPKKVMSIIVDAMELEEAIAVLCLNVSEEIQQKAYRPALEALAKRLNCWPLLLTLANGMLTDWVEIGYSIAQAFSDLEKAYQSHGVTAFHLDQESERHRSIEACLEVSLLHLQAFAKPHVNVVERYQELAVFPEDTDIPLTTLEIFWKGTGGFESWATKDLCMRLYRLSLVQIYDSEKGTIRLHDVLRSYLEHRVGIALMPTLHLSLLDAHWQTFGLKRWADLPQSDSYLWQRLIWHLRRAGRIEELEVTLTDLIYLTRKILYVGIAPLEADIVQVRAYEQKDTLPEPPLFAFLRQTIVRIGHLLRQVHTESEIGGLLLSYLGWQAPFALQRDIIEREFPRPLLTAWHPLPDGSSSALIRTLHGHTYGVNSCAVSPDGSWIVSGSNDSMLKVWDVATGGERLTLTGHTALVNSCAVSPDGSWIVSASSDNTLKVWDATVGEEYFTLRGHTSRVTSCAVSSDGCWIVSASSDKTLKVWNMAMGEECLTLRGHERAVNCCVVSPDGNWIVSASDDKTLKVWDIVTGEERLTLRGHGRAVNACAVSRDGNRIVSTSSDNTLKVWDVATGEERLTLRGHDFTVRGCAISPDGRWIVSASSDKTLKMWDAATGVERLSITGHTSIVTSCAVGLDGCWIVSASSDKTLKVWDVETEAKRMAVTGHVSMINSCVVSPNGRWIVSGSDDKTLKVWNMAMGEECLTLAGHTSTVRGCAVSPDGSWVVSASSDKTLSVWDVATRAKRLTLKGHENWVNGCAVSPDGNWIVSASNDRTLKIWDAATGAMRSTLLGHSATVSACAVSSDGRWIASASYDKTLKIWDVVMGEERLTLTGHTGYVNACAVSSDGRWIVSSSDDKTLKVWDAAMGEERLTLTGHTGWVNSCAVSPDGRRIASVSDDQTVKLWNSQTGQCVRTLPVDGSLSGCAFHPDGEHLVACGAQGMFFLQLLI